MSEVNGTYSQIGSNRSFRVIPETPAGEQPKSATPSEPVVRQGGVVTRYDAATGVLSTSTARKANVTPPVDRASATNSLGQPIELSEAGPKDLIRLPEGMGDGQAASLVMAGLLRKLPSGGYELAGDAARAAATDAEKPKADEQPADDGQVSLDGVTGTSVGADIVHGQLKKAAGDTVYTGLVHGLIKGTDTTAQIDEIARRSGQSVQDVRESVTGIYGEFESAAKSIAKANGVAPHAWNDFVAWASDNQPDAALDSFHNLVSKHEATGVARLAKQYARTGRNETAYSDADLLGATFGDGVKAVQTEKGVQLELRGHGRMSFKMAVARGLIKMSK